jgi:4-hydroxybenzoate polyprenyltransferase
MSKSILPYLQLIRLPNVVTAAADSLAGWLIVGGSLAAFDHWMALVAASMVLYASGTALNDLFDLEVDRVERPGRPLPSGRVSVRFAAWLGGLGLVLGPVLAAVGGSWPSAVVASILAAAILGYDAGLKHTLFGPEVMGICRGLNLLLGMSISPNLGEPYGWLAAASYALFVVGVTWISRSEAASGRHGGVIAGLVLENLALLGLAGAGLGFAGLDANRASRERIPLEGLLILAIVGLFVNSAVRRVLAHPTPANKQAAVKTGIFSLVWLNVAIVASAQGLPTALIVAALWFPAILLGRWLYAT